MPQSITSPASSLQSSPVRDLANHCIFCGEFGIVGHRSLRRNRKVATEVRLHADHD
jgi:hypothetical protein